MPTLYFSQYCVWNANRVADRRTVVWTTIATHSWTHGPRGERTELSPVRRSSSQDPAGHDDDCDRFDPDHRFLTVDQRCSLTILSHKQDSSEIGRFATSSDDLNYLNVELALISHNRLWVRPSPWHAIYQQDNARSHRGQPTRRIQQASLSGNRWIIHAAQWDNIIEDYGKRSFARSAAVFDIGPRCLLGAHAVGLLTRSIE